MIGRGSCLCIDEIMGCPLNCYHVLADGCQGGRRRCHPIPTQQHILSPPVAKSKQEGAEGQEDKSAPKQVGLKKDC